MRKIVLAAVLAAYAVSAVAVTIQMRRDTAANWTGTNPILAQGEWGCVTDLTPLRCKIGDGSSTWNNLQWTYDNITGKVAFPFDPTGWYAQDAANRNLPMFTVGDKYPDGIRITKWEITYTTGDPATELGAQLYRASDWSWTGETSMDVLDTTNGSSSETDPANINGGAVVANGQKIYIGFTADPTDSNVIVLFEMWFQEAQ